jgi:2-polyprenyl-6-hydroxyphenyl methylase/3-demethylubiquinone-9 3-methyltransferase
LASRGAHVIAIDPWISILSVAQKHAKKSKLDILYLAGAGESLPLESNSIDRVVSVDVLEHVIDLKTVLSEIHRVLIPGGIFFFDTLNRTWLSRMLVVGLLENILRIMPRGTHEPDKFIRPVELKAELEGLGFQVAPMVGMGPVRFNHRLEPVFGLFPSTAILYLGHAIKRT